VLLLLLLRLPLLPLPLAAPKSRRLDEDALAVLFLREFLPVVDDDNDEDNEDAGAEEPVPRLASNGLRSLFGFECVGALGVRSSLRVFQKEPSMTLNVYVYYRYGTYLLCVRFALGEYRSERASEMRAWTNGCIIRLIRSSG
jgi:hypothetical protein